MWWWRDDQLFQKQEGNHNALTEIEVHHQLESPCQTGLFPGGAWGTVPELQVTLKRDVSNDSQKTARGFCISRQISLHRQAPRNAVLFNYLGNLRSQGDGKGLERVHQHVFLLDGATFGFRISWLYSCCCWMILSQGQPLTIADENSQGEGLPWCLESSNGSSEMICNILTTPATVLKSSTRTATVLLWVETVYRQHYFWVVFYHYDYFSCLNWTKWSFSHWSNGLWLDWI